MSSVNFLRTLCQFKWALLLCSLGLHGGAFAQANYPSKPIKIVVPFGAGGVADLTARTVAQKMGDNMGQSIVIENKPGAGGVVATDLVATDVKCHCSERRFVQVIALRRRKRFHTFVCFRFI